MANHRVHIFDNGGKTYDRYTAVIIKTGDVFGFNGNPFHPQGFGQYSGNVTDRMDITYGYGWRNHFDEKKVLRLELREYVRQAKADTGWLGKEISIKSLPAEAQKYVKHISK